MKQKNSGTAAILRAIKTANVSQDATVQKSYRKILEEEINEGLHELQRPTLGLLISGFSAGLDVSFSVLIMAVVLSLGQNLSKPVLEIMLALGYSVGYILVVIGRSELFTEHTTRSVYPVLHGDASVAALARLWALIYVSNLAGCAIFAKAITFIGPALNVAQPWAFGHLSSGLVDHPGWVIFVSAILAGWLMGVLSWLVSAGRDSMAEITVVAIITATIGICHMHHCIVGTTEVLVGIFARQGTTWSQFAHFLVWATLGNATGGFVLVALIKYGHAMNAGSDSDRVELEEDEPS